MTLLPDIQGHGLNVYEYQRGDLRRFQIGAERTLIPDDGETNQEFAQRAERQVHAAFADPYLQKVMLVEELVDHSVTRYTLIVQSAPRLAPIALDARAAGKGRHGVPRGLRGGDRHRPVLN